MGLFSIHAFFCPEGVEGDTAEYEGIYWESVTYRNS